MVTISEIAKKAQVSRTIVSRVINNRPGVSAETREKILTIMKESHYTPNALARSLAMQKTQTIGVVMDNLCDSYFFKLIEGLQDTSEALNYNILFCSGRNNKELNLRYVDFLTQGRTDGVIAYGSYHQDQELFSRLESRSCNFVLIEGDIPSRKINNVILDNFKGAYTATEHLIQMGYQNICHFTGDMNYKVSLDRFNGFVKAMQDHSISIGVPNIIYADFFEDSGYTQMNRLIEEGKVPDAIFFGADKTAFGAMRAMFEHGMHPPEDVAIIGFDDDTPETTNILFPGLSTIRQPLYEMGAASVELLVKAINHPGMEPEVKVFEPELVLRDTCK
jgi:DNA-binding LacI/PurR family transcriptional regulator